MYTEDEAKELKCPRTKDFENCIGRECMAFVETESYKCPECGIVFNFKFCFAPEHEEGCQSKMVNPIVTYKCKIFHD